MCALFSFLSLCHTHRGDKAKFDFRNLFHFVYLHTITINKDYRVNAEDSYVVYMWAFCVPAEGDIEMRQRAQNVLVFNSAVVHSPPFFYFLFHMKM